MSDWKKVRLGDMCRIEKGVTGIASAEPGEYPLVVTAAERKTSDSYQFDCAAVCIPLVSSKGHGVKALNNVHYQEGKFALGTILCAVIPKNPEELSARYLHQYLQFNKDRVLVPLMKGAANVSLAVKDIASIEIPVPSIDNQKYFADLLNKVQLKGAKIQREFEKQKDILKKLRQSVLQDAIEGKLTEDWRKKHPVIKGDINYDAEALYNHIQQEKQKLIAAGKIKKEKPLPEIKPEEKLFDIPKSWNWLRLGCVCFSTMAGTSFACEHRITEGNEWGVIKTSAITSGEFLESENKVYSRTTPEDVSARIYEGDFLFCRASGSKGLAGTSCIVRKISLNLLLSDKSIRLDLSKKVNLNFVQKLNNSFWGERYRLSLGTAKSTSMNNVTRDQILGFYFPFPPLAEQNEIVHRVECALKKIDELEQQITTRETYTQTLLQTTLQTFFQVR